MRYALLLASLISLSSLPSFAQSSSDVYKITSAIQSLTDEIGAPVVATSEPYKSGLIDPAKVVGILNLLHADPKKPTIIHLLRWKDATHSAVSFQKWYFYDPSPPLGAKASFYLQSKEQVFQRTAIPGYTDFQFVYIHLNADLAGGTKEWQAPVTVAQPNPTLSHPISYSVTVTKAQTQFIQDVQTALQILGLKAADATVSTGYYSVATFQAQWTTSTITIAASLDSANKNQGTNSTTTKASSNQLSSNTYTNEKPSWIGLSAGVPITNYQDIEYQSSSGTLVPKTITQQNVYFFLDGYFPPVLPSLASFRYIPQPFFGLPIKGKVFRHSMLGAGIGLHWIEPYGGVIFDTQNNQVKGPGVNKTGITYQWVFGIKMSMTAASKALKAKTASK